MENFLKDLNHLNVFNYTNLKRYKTPQEFYLAIKTGLEMSEEVYISTMYFGEDEKSELLLQIIAKRNKRNKKTVVILDESRGMRTWFRERIIKYNLEDCVFAKRMNSPLLPRRLSEYISVFHSKVIVFDDKILFTGSNLSNDYFYNRLDRYYNVEDYEMAGYLKNNFFNFLVNSSTKINGFNIIRPEIKFEECKVEGINKKDNLEECKVEGINKKDNLEECRVEGINKKYFNNQFINQSKILIYKGKTESKILKLIQAYKFEEIYLSTAYLNFPNAFFDILRNSNVKIIVNDPETNKFNNYGRFCGFVTELYKYSTLYTARKLLNSEIYEFKKDGYTMHSKGIWAFSKTFCLTSVGSSNLNRRSYERDNELNVLLLTKNKKDIKILREEVKFMIDNSKRRTIGVLEGRNYNIFVILMFFLIEFIFVIKEG